MLRHPHLLAGYFVEGTGPMNFRAVNPSTRQPIPVNFPVCTRDEMQIALVAATDAARVVRGYPGDAFAEFLDAYALRLDKDRDTIIATAAIESPYPVKPRLHGEMDRTVGQLRQAAKAAKSGDWRNRRINAKDNIRSFYASAGPAVIFGPNNFLFAFNPVAGGHFAAAIASGSPVIAKGHPSHPDTTRLFAEHALATALATGMPRDLVQMVYDLEPEHGLDLMSDRRIGTVAYTGSKKAGRRLKRHADEAGIPFHLEEGGGNPIVILPEAIRDRGQALVDECAGSCLMGTGQFCTKSGLLLLLESPETNVFLSDISAKFVTAPVGTLLSNGTMNNLSMSVRIVRDAGAELLTGGDFGTNQGYCFQNTILRVSGQQFLANPGELQTEMFGNAVLAVVAASYEELLDIIGKLDRTLTGSIYAGAADFMGVSELAEALRPKVGRLLKDQMPTGVAVTPPMQHGFGFFTSVGLPDSILMFVQKQCFQGFTGNPLPELLRGDADLNLDL